jgi:hypothetical protein
MSLTIIEVNVMRANAYEEIAREVSAIEIIANVTKIRIRDVSL